MKQDLRVEIDKATDQLNKLCEEMELARAEHSEKELKELELLVAKKMYYREGLIKALKIVREYTG